MQILQHIARAAGKSRVMKKQKGGKDKFWSPGLKSQILPKKRQKVKTSELKADQVTLFTSLYDNIVELLLLTKDLMIS